MWFIFGTNLPWLQELWANLIQIYLHFLWRLPCLRYVFECKWDCFVRSYVLFICTCMSGNKMSIMQSTNIILPAEEFPRQKEDGFTTASSSKWDSLYWSDNVFILNRPPDHYLPITTGNPSNPRRMYCGMMLPTTTDPTRCICKTSRCYLQSSLAKTNVMNS